MDEELEKLKTIQEKIAAQKKFQDEHKYPDFAPRNGICFRCRRQIYEVISFQKASTKLITGCPYCCYSYCN